MSNILILVHFVHLMFAPKGRSFSHVLHLTMFYRWIRNWFQKWHLCLTKYTTFWKKKEKKNFKKCTLKSDNCHTVHFSKILFNNIWMLYITMLNITVPSTFKHLFLPLPSGMLHFYVSFSSYTYGKVRIFQTLKTKWSRVKECIHSYVIFAIDIHRVPMNSKNS